MPVYRGLTPFVVKTLRSLARGHLTADAARRVVADFVQCHGATRAFLASPMNRLFEAALDGRVLPREALILHDLWRYHLRRTPGLFLENGFPPDDEFDDVYEVPTPRQRHA